MIRHKKVYLQSSTYADVAGTDTIARDRSVELERKTPYEKKYTEGSLALLRAGSLAVHTTFMLTLRGHIFA